MVSTFGRDAKEKSTKKSDAEKSAPFARKKVEDQKGRCEKGVRRTILERRGSERGVAIERRSSAAMKRKTAGDTGERPARNSSPRRRRRSFVTGGISPLFVASSFGSANTLRKFPIREGGIDRREFDSAVDE